MGAIAGCYSREPSGSPQELLDVMVNSLRHRGKGGFNILCCGRSVAMVQLETWPQTKDQSQPRHPHDTETFVVFHGVLTNHDELRSQGVLPDDHHNDQDWVLAAYRKWGEGFVNHLYGEFALAIWLPRENRLICARDHIGVKPFYYVMNDDTFIFATEIRALLDTGLVSTELNEHIIYEQLYDDYVDDQATLYRDIQRIPPAHILSIDKHSHQLKRYWRLAPQPRLICTSQDDYVEHFMGVFAQTVSTRIPRDHDYAADLSGGLDSSTVVGMAQKLVADQGVRPVITVSTIFPGLRCDESHFINDVVRFWEIDHSLQFQPAYNFDDFQRDMDRSGLPPHGVDMLMCAPYLEQLNNKGVRVLLSGIGGDELFSGGANSYPDLLMMKRFNGLITEFLHAVRNAGAVRSFRNLLAALSWPVLPAQFREKLLSVRRRFIESSRILQGRHSDVYLKHISQFSYLSDLSIVDGISSAWMPYLLEANDDFCGSQGIEYRYPFLDVRMIEFALSLPEPLRNHAGVSKVILRMAGQELLPESVRHRTDKADFSYLDRELMQTEMFGSSFERETWCLPEGVSRDQLTNHLRRLKQVWHDNPDHLDDASMLLWNAFALQSWASVVKGHSYV